MIEKVDNIDIYNDSAIILNNTEIGRINSWIVTLILFLILTIIFLSIPFNVYNTLIGKLEINKDEVYFKAELEYDDFPVNKKNKLYIKGVEYKYKVISIEDKVATLKIEIDDSIKIQNNVIFVNILKEKTTIFKYLKEKLKKGLQL